MNLPKRPCLITMGRAHAGQFSLAGSSSARPVAEVAPITGPMYQLFIFFMITDPKTTVQTTWGQCVVAFLVALAEMMLRLHESDYAPLDALFLVGPSANLLDIWWHARQSATVSAPHLA